MASPIFKVGREKYFVQAGQVLSVCQLDRSLMYKIRNCFSFKSPTTHKYATTLELSFANGNDAKFSIVGLGNTEADAARDALKKIKDFGIELNLKV
jgi:hypothetical protein